VGDNAITHDCFLIPLCVAVAAGECGSDRFEVCESVAGTAGKVMAAANHALHD